MTTPVFALSRVSKTRTGGPGYALDIPQLTILPGETLAITGPSGSGKSTALDLLGMVLKPDTAETFTLHVGGATVDVAACWRQAQQDRLADLRLRHMGYVLQTGGLLPFLSVRQNMELTATVNALPHTAEHVQTLAAQLGISRLLDLMPEKLSIGERQRVAIGRALASRPAVILADEPTAALDPYHADAVLDLFLDAAGASGVTLILVTHDERIVTRRNLRELRINIQQQTDGVSRAVLEA